MVINLTKNRFFNRIRKLNSKTQSDLEVFMLLKENLLQNVKLWQYLAMNLSFIFQFQLVPFALILIFREPLISFLL